MTSHASEAGINPPNEVIQNSWNRQRSTEELTSFVLDRLMAVESVA